MQQCCVCECVTDASNRPSPVPPSSLHLRPAPTWLRSIRVVVVHPSLRHDRTRLECSWHAVPCPLDTCPKSTLYIHIFYVPSNHLLFLFHISVASFGLPPGCFGSMSSVTTMVSRCFTFSPWLRSSNLVGFTVSCNMQSSTTIPLLCTLVCVVCNLDEGGLHRFNESENGCHLHAFDVESLHFEDDAAGCNTATSIQ